MRSYFPYIFDTVHGHYKIISKLLHVHYVDTTLFVHNLKIIIHYTKCYTIHKLLYNTQIYTIHKYPKNIACIKFFVPIEFRFILLYHSFVKISVLRILIIYSIHRVIVIGWLTYFCFLVFCGCSLLKAARVL